MRSQMAEVATIELINKYVQSIEVNSVDERGNRVYMLPLNEINNLNRRTEEAMPIDKYDWLSFEKIFHPVMVYPESEKSHHCKFYFNYSINLPLYMAFH